MALLLEVDFPLSCHSRRQVICTAEKFWEQLHMAAVPAAVNSAHHSKSKLAPASRLTPASELTPASASQGAHHAADAAFEGLWCPVREAADVCAWQDGCASCAVAKVCQL